MFTSSVDIVCGQVRARKFRWLDAKIYVHFAASRMPSDSWSSSGGGGGKATLFSVCLHCCKERESDTLFYKLCYAQN